MLLNNSLHTDTLGSVLPYISLNNTDGVLTLLVPKYDDGCSPEIELPNLFPFGKKSHFKAYVRTIQNLIVHLLSL